MASPLILALAATTVLSVAVPAVACQGQGCWGMAPVQEANPGYQPDYSQYAAAEGYGPEQPGPGEMGPPPGYDSGPGGPGDQAYGPPPADAGPGSYGPPPGYGPGDGAQSGDYDREPAGHDNGPYIGPVEGLADQYDAAPDGSQAYGQPYGPPPPPPAYGYGYGAEGAYSGEGEPPAAYQPAPPPPPSTYSYDRYSYGNAPYAGPAPRWSSGQERAAPYQAYSRHGYERYHPWRREEDGSWRKSYRAGSVHTYDYDSGWVEDQPHGGWSPGDHGGGWTVYPPMSHDRWGPPPPAGPGPAPCTECGETY